MLVRLVNMRGVNLNVFDFDYDLTWVGFFLNAQERVYGRYGGRDAGEADARLTLPGLKHAMQQALATHRREARTRPTRSPQPELIAESYPASRNLKAGACIHCHQVYEFRREVERTRGTWRNELSWNWLPPPPDNLGLHLDVNRGNRIVSVRPDSPAGRAGLRADDELTSLNYAPVAAIADVQMALRDAPQAGTIPVTYLRGTRTVTGSLVVTGNWKQSDLSWRAFMWGLAPQASVYGKDLTEEEKRTLGLSPKALAFRQGNYVPDAARGAGIRANDLILGVDGKRFEMTMLQFNASVRLNYKVGDRVVFNLIRNGQRLEVPMTLPDR